MAAVVVNKRLPEVSVRCFCDEWELNLGLVIIHV